MASSFSKADIKWMWKFVFVLCCWYFVSSSNGIFGKIILTSFELPLTLCMVQLVSIIVYGFFILRILKIRPLTGVTWRYYLKWVGFLAFNKAFSSVAAHVSIWKTPVSYAHTVKATMPLFTVFFTRTFFGTQYSYKTYFSLFPIVCGVYIASISEVQFELTGLLSALTACGGFSIMTIMTKKVTEETGVHTLRLLVVLAQLAALFLFPLWLLHDLPQILVHPIVTAQQFTWPVIGMIIVDGFFHFIQNVLAFALMKMVSSLTYSVINVSKRIMIISSSVMYLQNNVSTLNVIGMSMSIFGVFFYNKVKLDERNAQFLPKTKSDVNRNVSTSLWNGNSYPTSKVQLATPAAPPSLNNHYTTMGNGGPIMNDSRSARRGYT